jgi:hypothetical protein
MRKYAMPKLVIAFDPADAKRMTVNLQPDEPGYMHRNRTVLTGTAQGYDLVPPTQRLGEPSKQQYEAAQTYQDSIGSFDSQEHIKCYDVVLDKQTAARMRQPSAHGTSEAYRCLAYSYYDFSTCASVVSSQYSPTNGSIRRRHAQGCP